MEQKIKVGDIIYGKNRIYGINEKLEVERLTKTQAVCKNHRFKIDVNNGKVEEIGQGSLWDATRYYLETEELKEEYFRQTSVRKLKSYEFDKLDTGTLKSILGLLNQNSKP